jgi:hypothetical protein
MSLNNAMRIVLVQVLDLTNAQLTGSIPTAWFDSSARKTEARALLLTIQANRGAHQQHATNTVAPGVATPLGQMVVTPTTVHALEQAAAASNKPGISIGLTQLQELRLAGNHLNGSIKGIELLSSLGVLDLSGNKLGGQLPLQLATLSKLQVGHS